MSTIVSAVLDRPAHPAGLVELEFELDLRVVESVTPLVELMCSTSDGCGSSCSTSACSTASADPV